MSHAYKKVAKARPLQYRPADAVRARGDGWRYGDEVWNIKNETFLALGDPPVDRDEASLMRLYERGQLPRVQE